MIGTDWLRRKAAGAVRIESSPAAMPTQADVAMLSVMLAQVVAADEQAQQRVQSSGERLGLGCPCSVIYSRCYYGHKEA